MKQKADFNNFIHINTYMHKQNIHVPLFNIDRQTDTGSRAQLVDGKSSNIYPDNLYILYTYTDLMDSTEFQRIPTQTLYIYIVHI